MVQASTLWVLGQLAVLGGLLYHALRARRLAPLGAFVVLFVLASSLGLLYEYRVLLLLGLLLSISPEDRTGWRIAAPLAGILAAVLLFTKLSSGLAGIAMVSLAGLAWLVQRRAGIRDLLLQIALPFVAVVVVLTFTLLGGPGALVEWLRVASEFTAGYSEAMSYPGPSSIEILVGAAVAVYLLAAFLMSRRERSATPVALALGALILLAFRHGMVRHYGRFVPAIVIVAIATLVLAVRSKRGIAIGLGASSIVAALAFGMTTVPECLCPRHPEALGPAEGWMNLVSVIRLPETRRRLAAETSARLADDRLPEEMVAAIRSGGGSVDAIPWEIAFTRANALRWQPNPVLQTYSAYSSSLDRWTAEHFDSQDAPRFLLVQFGDIDDRHPMLATPATWQAILQGYEPSPFPIAEGAFGQVALLHRREVSSELALRPIGRGSGRIGQRIEVPPSEELVFGSIHLRHDLSGRLAALAWRVDPLLIDLELADGGVITVRFLPSTAPNGLLLNRLPMTLQELLDLYGGRRPREVVAIRIHGTGTSSFDSEFDIEWFEAPWAE